MKHSIRLITTLGCTLLFSCTDHGTNSDTGVANDPPDSEVSGCRSTPAAVDRDRRVLVQTPYNADMSHSNNWRALTLTADGTLRDDNEFHSLGRAIGGTMVTRRFTGIRGAGSAASSRSKSHGAPSVSWTPAFRRFLRQQTGHGSTGEVMWIVDENWPENGGGICGRTSTAKPGLSSFRLLDGKTPLIY